MTAPVYPQAIAGWTDRIDEVNIVWAADPNQLAAEVLSVEKTLGKMPQIEPGPPVGNPITYGSVSNRITDAMTSAQLPYVDLYASNFRVGYGSWNYGVFNTYRAVEDNYHYFNGSDITIKAPGVYLLDHYQTWAYYNEGYMGSMLAINNVFARGDWWHWTVFPSSGPHDAAYTGRWATTSFGWMGKLNTGDRIRIASANNTTNSSYQVINSSLRMQYLRSLTSAQAKAALGSYAV